MERGVNFLLNKKDQSLNKTNGANEVMCQRVTETTSDLLTSLANEPSLAYFHIQEHIRKSTPEMLRYQSKIGHLDSQLRGFCYDLDYAIDNVKSITKATTHFGKINELLKSSLFAKLQLDYARMSAPPIEVGIDLALWDLNDEELLSLTHKETRGRKPSHQYNEDVTATDPSSRNNNKYAETSTNSGTLSHISSTMSTAAVQVRDHAVNLTRRVLWTQSADLSYTAISPSMPECEIPYSSSSLDDKPKFLEAGHQ
ncbi:BLOC-1-related complex subunit 8 [Schistosoma japonicum]|uniref:BLOC-1-related complex subunit 8 n=1 Tax=Schistosoma japonicum TaxID=6182 RepID=A0A4Z2CN91_SCHJA|nr:BLOC-1-related complex subunit 8 like [Schistosoma japonicum]TNN05743.1 BLOC-1-related complex subunit 8 [Schistosoma japonicum]